MTQKRWNKHSFAHKLVRDLQIEMAHQIYDAKAHDNTFFKNWKGRETEFVNMVAPTLRDHARSTLGELLGRHDVSQEDKDEIYQALLLDATVPNEDRFTLH